MESAIKTVHDHTFSCQKELQFMVADNRAAQKHAAGLQLVTTGWPNGLTPQQREYMLGWMLGNTPEIVTYLQATWSSGTELRPHRSLPERLREFLVQRAVHGPGHGAPEGRVFQWHDAPEF